ncbi:uncharacterized protein LOC135842290 [Planococcus citri]|uniref:uncharacterized protein LOC135842290 n=1 Tax=Planococcus citri TaxID=170843 RepID=UPI0031F977E4
MISHIKIIGVYLMIIIVVCGIDREYELTDTEDELNYNEEGIGSGGNKIDLSKCERLRTYNDSYIFYPAKDIKTETGFFLKFNVKAKRGVRIIFSPTNQSANGDHKVFEVFIYSGGDNSSISVIRTRQNSKSSTHTHFEENMLSPMKWRQFWIRISSDGTLIEVGKKGSIPFMSSRTEPRLIEYYGFASENNFVNYAFLCFERNNGGVSQYRTLTTYDHAYTFYPIENIKNDDVIFLEFVVKTDQDAHIIFSPTNETAKTDEKVFKVTLGGYTTNTISTIKTSENDEPGSEYHEKDILSPDEWRQFWILITPDETSIEVGKKGSSAFMSLEMEPTLIKYYGFASGDSFANWAFPNLQNADTVRNMSGLECIFDSECPQNKACIGKKCRDPCDGMCGKNTKCGVDSHVPTCSCKDGLFGDPLTECVEEENLPKYTSMTSMGFRLTMYPIGAIKKSNEIFMNFNVKGESAVIYFSSTDQLKVKDAKYEYFGVSLGSEADNDSFIISPRMSDSNKLLHIEEDPIISTKEWRQFWIRITLDGSSIEVGKNGKPAFMSLKIEPQSLEYFAFASEEVCRWKLLCSKDTNTDLLRYRTLAKSSRSYPYSNYYSIMDIKNNDEIFVKFDVKAQSCQIVFIENFPNIKGYYLIIYLNAYNHTNGHRYSTIFSREHATTHYEENIISPDEWRQFWVRITPDGSSIEVGKNKQPAFMSLETTPMSIKYYIFLVICTISRVQLIGFFLFFQIVPKKAMYLYFYNYSYKITGIGKDELHNISNQTILLPFNESERIHKIAEVKNYLILYLLLLSIFCIGNCSVKDM